MDLHNGRSLRHISLQNSVRHNLSLNPMFVKVERPLTDRGKGYYWTVKDEEGMDARTGESHSFKNGHLNTWLTFEID